jgi:hypothetical protein
VSSAMSHSAVRTLKRIVESELIYSTFGHVYC